MNVGFGFVTLLAGNGSYYEPGSSAGLQQLSASVPLRMAGMGLRGHSMLGPWRKSDSIPTASTALHFPTRARA